MCCWPGHLTFLSVILVFQSHHEEKDSHVPDQAVLTVNVNFSLSPQWPETLGHTQVKVMVTGIQERKLTSGADTVIPKTQGRTTGLVFKPASYGQFALLPRGPRFPSHSKQP